MNQKNIIAILGVVVVILIGTTAYFATINNASQPAVPAQKVVQQPMSDPVPANQQPTLPSSDKTIGWNTYTNKRYGYTISYPKNWFVDTTYSEDAITQRGDPNDADFIGGDTNWSNYKDSFDLGNTPKDIQTVFLMIFKQDKAKTLDEFLKIENFDFTKKEAVQINGVAGVRISGGNFDVPDQNVEHVILMKNGLFFTFSNGVGEKSADAKDILETMISTFKFKK